MLPHLADRPLNLQRFPNGAAAQGFWQKDIPPSSPKWLTIWHETGFREREDRAANDHLVADRAAALCWLGNQASFEIHAWTSTLQEPWMPTFALIDIDPGTKTTWDETLVLAQAVSDRPRAPRHPRVPQAHRQPRHPGLDPDRARPLRVHRHVAPGSRSCRGPSAGRCPDLVSWEWAKADRGGKARLDYTQNAAIKTLVAPYAVRPRPGAPVSAPIRWEELDDPASGPTAGRSRRSRRASPRSATCGRASQEDHQVLPPL